MGSRNFSRRKLLPLLSLWLGAASLVSAADVLSVDAPGKTTIKRGEAGELRLKLHLEGGYHSNSNTPSEDYLIPFKLTWDAATFASTEIEYPKPHMEKYDFSPKPLSVFTGSFEVVTKFKVSPTAPAGPGMVTGKLRYQACNKNSCLPPKTIPIQLPVIIL